MECKSKDSMKKKTDFINIIAVLRYLTQVFLISTRKSISFLKFLNMLFRKIPSRITVQNKQPLFLKKIKTFLMQELQLLPKTKKS